MLMFTASAPLRLNMAWRTSRTAVPHSVKAWTYRRASYVRACVNASTTPEVTVDVIRKTAQLASLEIGEDEVEPLTEQFGKIIDLFNNMKQIDVEGVEPMTRPQDSENVMRDDVPSRFDDVDGIMEEVPVVENDFVRVPKISSESDN